MVIYSTHEENHLTRPVLHASEVHDRLPRAFLVISPLFAKPELLEASSCESDGESRHVLLLFFFVEGGWGSSIIVAHTCFAPECGLFCSQLWMFSANMAFTGATAR